MQDLGIGFRVTDEVVNSLELSTELRHDRIRQNERMKKEFPNVLGDNRILLSGGGDAMVVKTIGFDAEILRCLCANFMQNNIVLHVDDAGIMKMFATFSIGAVPKTLISICMNKTPIQQPHHP